MPIIKKIQNRFRSSKDETLKVPARFMRPRMILILIVLALSIFGCVMIYSAHSIVSMEQRQNPAVMGIAQFRYLLIGLVIAYGISRVDYHFFTSKPVILFGWFLVIGVLTFTILKGRSAKGATRWLQIGGITLQPSEFAKIYFIVLGTYCISFIQDSTKYKEQIRCGLAFVFVLIPLLLILKQPDKGGTAIIAGTLLIMLLYSGIVDFKGFGIASAIGAVAILVLSFSTEYSRQRIDALFHPMEHRFGISYQIVQGRIAFGSGGLFGVGIGQGGSKYSYLPEAHNDFILAVIGEECGLIGTLAVVAAFCIILYCAYDIAKNANDKKGMLVASGAGTILMLQFMLNAGGELGLIPLSGKPIPFLSYGGSSLLTSMALFGLIWSVSVHSKLPETEHDRLRGSMSVASANGSSTRRSQTNDFTVISGGADTRRSSRTDTRRSSRRESRTSSSRPSRRDTRAKNTNLNGRSNDRNKHR